MIISRDLDDICCASLELQASRGGVSVRLRPLTDVST